MSGDSKDLLAGVSMDEQEVIRIRKDRRRKDRTSGVSVVAPWHPKHLTL